MRKELKYRLTVRLYCLVLSCVLLCAASYRSFAEKPSGQIPPRKVRIYYRWDKFTIDTTYMGNAAGIRALDSIMGSPRFIIDSLQIISSASPEGNIRYNDRLSLSRGLALKQHLQSLSDRAGQISVVPLGSNFPGFLDFLKSDTSVPHSGDMVSLFEEHPEAHPDTLYRRIMRMWGGVPYGAVKRNVLPYLRYAEIEVYTYPKISGLPLVDAGLLPETAAVGGDTAGLCSPLSGAGAGTSVDIPSAKKRRFWYPVLKTNLLYDVVTALNAEVEFPLTKKISVMVEDVFPWWKWGTNDKKYCLQLWSMGIEPRWWFRRTDRRDWLSGHFAGVYAMSGKYDLQWKTTPCYQGEYWSAGLTYGYAVPLCRWLNMEFSISAGYVRSDYRHYQPDEGYDHLFRDKYDVGTRSWFGPTKLKVSLVLPLGRDSHNAGTKRRV